MTLRIQEDDEEYSLDQIKEFENVQQPNWNDISGAYKWESRFNLGLPLRYKCAVRVSANKTSNVEYG